MRLGVTHALRGGDLVPGDVLIAADGTVAAVGVKPAGRAGVAVPGFVDLPVNGFAGVDFLGADAGDYARAGEALAATGVTAYQPTLISAPARDVRRALAAIREAALTTGPRIIGAHLEGPFLSPAWPGAHDPRNLQPADLALADALLAAGPVTMMTVAPELPEGLLLVEGLRDRGIVVSIGHTDADADRARRAFECGARAITHVHNAHRRFAPRDPGPAGVALSRDDVAVMAIADGVHLAPETLRVAHLAAGARLCLVSDAIEAAGLGDGDFRLGDRAVRVAGGAARLQDGTLAGSVGTLDHGLRQLVAAGATLPEAAHAASTAPARLAGLTGLGELAPGAPADVTVLDDRLEVVRTLVAGVERYGR
jgi:N-acetylglucosamine-6-phosphate deacetylase